MCLGFCYKKPMMSLLIVFKSLFDVRVVIYLKPFLYLLVNGHVFSLSVGCVCCVGLYSYVMTGEGSVSDGVSDG